MIKGGIAANIVPDSCSVRLDRRILPGESVESVTKEIQNVIDEIKQEDGELEA